MYTFLDMINVEKMFYYETHFVEKKWLRLQITRTEKETFMTVFSE